MPLRLPPLPAIDRRRLLVGAAVGGGLLIGWGLLPRRYPSPLPAGEDELAAAGWLKVGGDGMVTLAVPQLEMGQGVYTVLAQVAAVELGADWRQMAIQPAPVSELYANAPLAARWADLLGPGWLPGALGGGPGPDGAAPAARHWAERHRFMATAEGLSLAAYEAPIRAAAASARALLTMVAARDWGVAWETCEARAGAVHHGERVAPFGTLTERAARLTPPDPPVLRAEPASENPSTFPEGGTPAFPRLDLPAKVAGAFPFAADVRLPDMVFAAVAQGPVGAATRLEGVDEAHARAVPGCLRLVTGKDFGWGPWVGALATNSWAAQQALTRAAPRFAGEDLAEGKRIAAALSAALKDSGGHALARIGDAPAAIGERPTLSARYDIAPALHAGIETASATARLRPGGLLGERLELWIATQSPETTRAAVASALGLSVRDVLLYPVAAGGSFDSRLETPHAVQAALLAREAGRPVQLTWTRAQEHLGIPGRPPAAIRIEAKCDETGALTAWHVRAALPASAREFAARMFHGHSRASAMAGAGDPWLGGNADPLALEGAQPPYAVPELLVEHVPTEVGLPSGRLRGNAHGYTAFCTESFLDELAVALGREPLSYRMAMLGGDPRLAACLQRVSALAGWNGGRDGSGQGLACHRIGPVDSGGCVAAIASARRDENGPRVDRISAVVDIGRVVNADIARQQIEGGLIFGLGLALGSASGWSRGLPMLDRLGQLALPRLADCPRIEVEFIASSAPACDPGELGVAVAAPAIANALFSATGLRFRRLPLASED